MNDFRDDALEHQEIILDFGGLGQPGVTFEYELFHFVVAAPQSQRCVMAQTFYILDKFLTDVCFEFRCQLINCAR